MYPKPAVLPAWGESNQTPDDMIQPSNPEIQAGWPSSPVPPSRQRFNWILHYLDNAARYLMQRGLVDWDASDTYATGARVIGDDGNTYKSIQDANANHTPSSSPTWWVRWGYLASDLVNFAFGSPTATTQAAADNSTKVATTAFVQAVLAGGGASGTFAANGYVRLGNGLILQWAAGAADVGAGNAGQTIVLPFTFPNAALWAIAGLFSTDGASTSIMCYDVTAYTVNSVSVMRQRRGDNGARTTTPLVLAIGY